MNKIKSVSIPEPCKQSWQQMVSVNSGRHCDSCSKTVIDFTAKTDAEIIKYFSTKRDACGRFADDQLPRVNQLLQMPKPRKNMWKQLGITAFVAGLFSITKVDAQVHESARIHKTIYANVNKNPSKAHLRADSLYSKELTTGDIHIDINSEPNNINDSKVNLTCLPLTGILGGVTVAGIVVNEDIRNSYLWSILFRH